MRIGTFVTVVALLFLPSLAEAKIFRIGRKSGARQGSTLSIRRRLSISPLIAAQGTFELDVTGGFSTLGNYVIPATLRYTPESDNFYFGHTEWGVSANISDSQIGSGQRTTHLSDHVTLQSTTAFKIGELNLAVAPQFEVITRGLDGGYRGGGTAVARIDHGLSTFGSTLAWTGATRATDSNPSGIWDIGFGFGRKFGKEGIWNNLTAHGNVTIEKQTGANRFYTLLEGVEYQITERFGVDISGQHIGIGSGLVVDHQILLGLSWTFGRRK